MCHIVIVTRSILECISVLCSITHISIREETIYNTLLHLQVEYSLLFTVINAGHTGKVTFLVVELDLIYYICRNVLKSHILVGTEKILAFHKDTVDSLSVYFYGTVFTYVHTRILLYEFFEHRAFGHTECRSVEHQRVFCSCNRRHLSRYYSSFQCNGIGRKFNLAKIDILSFYHFKVTVMGHIPDK